MISKIRIITHRAIAIILAAVMCTWMIPIGTVIQASAEGDEYITELTLMDGDMAVETLEESGYTVLPQSLNPSSIEAASSIYIGYKTGGEGSAIRDLKVSSSGEGSITVGDCSYQKISDISLNTGAGGTSLYLYASYDAAAGEALRGLSFQIMKSTEGIEGAASVLSSDGSEIVSTADGEVADFDEGIADSELYLKMYKGDIYRPYVEDVFAAKGKSEEAAVKKLAGMGCTYYVNYNIEKGDDVLMLGYTRTADETKALRALVAVGSNKDEIVIKDVTYNKVEGSKVTGKKSYSFYTTKDETAGEPIMDLVVCTYEPSGLGEDAEKEEAEEQQDDKEHQDSDADGEATEEAGSEASEESEGEDSSEAEGASSEEEEESGGSSDDGAGEEDAPIVGEVEDDSWWFSAKTAKAAERVVVAENEVGESAATEEMPAPEPAVSEPEPDSASDDASDPAEDTPKSEEKEESSSDDGSSGEIETTGTDEEGAAPEEEKEAEQEEEQEEEEAEEELDENAEPVYAAGTRVYSEITTKDWISGYFLRGSSQAAIYLYEESAYNSAEESSDPLWISNIYCSDKKGNQFVNNIGYVTKADGNASNSPFEETVPYDEAGKEEAGSTASVFSSPVSIIVIVGLVVLIVIGATVGIVYRKRKSGEKAE